MYVFSQKLNWKIPEWNNTIQEKNISVIFLKKKKNQSAAKYMHKVKSSNHAEGLMMKAIIPSLSLLTVVLWRQPF